MVEQPQTCPSCEATLTASPTLEWIVCSRCRASFGPAASRRPELSRLALVSFLIAVASLIVLIYQILNLKGGSPVPLLFVACFALAAIPFGLGAIESIDLPHKYKKGKAFSLIGMILGFLVWAVPVGFVVGMSLLFLGFRMESNSSLSVFPEGDDRRSIFEESPDIRSAGDYEGLLDESVVWSVYHPVAQDPIELFPKFHTTFANVEFDDSEWRQNVDLSDGIGYGDKRYGIQLRKPEKKDRRTAYFRARFQTTAPVKAMAAEFSMDDGVIVYINGQEVLRTNVPESAKEGYYLMASQSVSNEDETLLVAKEFELAKALPPGEHVIAISLHNCPSSSDLGIRVFRLYGKPKLELEGNNSDAAPR